MLGERGWRKGLEGCLGGVESSGPCFLCEDELRFSAESQGEGSWVGGVRRVKRVLERSRRAWRKEPAPDEGKDCQPPLR